MDGEAIPSDQAKRRRGGRTAILSAGLVGVALGVAAASFWRIAEAPPSSAFALDEPWRTRDPMSGTRRAAAQWVVYARAPSLIGDEPSAPVDVDLARRTHAAYLRSTLVLTSALQDERVSSCDTLRDREDPIGWLADHLVAYYPNNGSLLTLALPHPSAPESDLVAIVRAIASAYQDEVVFREQSRRRQPLQILKSHLGGLRRRIQSLADGVVDSAEATIPAPERRELDALLAHEQELLSRIQRLELESAGPDRVLPVGATANGVAAVGFYSSEPRLPWLGE